MTGREIHFTYLNGPDVERLALTDEEILGAVEAGLAAQGLGQAVIEPRVHLEPDPAFRGHFNVLRGYVAPLSLAGNAASRLEFAPTSLEGAAHQRHGLGGEIAVREWHVSLRAHGGTVVTPAELLFPPGGGSAAMASEAARPSYPSLRAEELEGREVQSPPVSPL